jgi:prefoldin subunit 5
MLGENVMKDYNCLKRKKGQLELQIVHLEKELDKKSKKLKEIDIELRRLEEREDMSEMCLDG